MSDTVEAGVGERCCVVGESNRAQAGDDAEGEVERADKDASGQVHPSLWDAEVRDEPESV